MGVADGAESEDTEDDETGRGDAKLDRELGFVSMEDDEEEDKDEGGGVDGVRRSGEEGREPGGKD